MKLNYSSLIFIVLIGLISGCRKDPPISSPIVNSSVNNTDPDFIFFPTKNAKWIIKSNFNSPDGIVNCLDTFYLGKDTAMLSRTRFNSHSNYGAYVDSASIKNYKEIVVSVMYISSTFDTTYSHPYRFGWFRQDIIEKKIYTPHINTNDDMLDEHLSLNLNLEIGDTTDFTSISQFPLIVKSVDNIAFGGRYLKHISYGPPSYTQATGEMIQGFDFVSYNINFPGSLHPSNRIWKKFIYKTDTLLVTY